MRGYEYDRRDNSLVCQCMYITKDGQQTVFCPRSKLSQLQVLVDVEDELDVEADRLNPTLRAHSC